MNKPVVAASPTEVVTLSPAQALAPGEVVIGVLLALDGNGYPLVCYPQCAEDESVVAMSTLAVMPQHVGRQVALLFANGDCRKPVIMGFVHSPLDDLLEDFVHSESSLPSPDVDAGSALTGHRVAEAVRVDGERLVIEAQKEIVLVCGDSSITLTKAGKILIRGKYLSSRSSGVNRILGGSVQVN